ncbi:GNAT family N-acetyltransferase [Mycolicibacterium sp. 120320]|uniref:GNAT family N-acetyltransferase n=1 Tax=unclassified Mycolicibacterium TaxID=2636767 RepID=UPI003FA55E95
MDSAGSNIGAVWTFQHEPALVRDADAQAMPEIAIAVSPSHRGAGVGSALLDELLRRAGFRSVGQARGPLGIAMVSQYLWRCRPRRYPTTACRR